MFVGVHEKVREIQITEEVILTVPLLAWKMVTCKTNTSLEAIVIIIHNEKNTAHPRLSESSWSGVEPICEDICRKYQWDEISELAKGHGGIYCCDFNDVVDKLNIKHLDLVVRGVLDVYR